MKDTGEGVSFTFQFRKCDRSSYYIWCIWYVSEVCFCVSRCIRNKHLTKWFHAIGQKSWFKHAWPCALEQESLVFLIIVIVLKIVLSKRINSILNQIWQSNIHTLPRKKTWCLLVAAVDAIGSWILVR